MKDGRPVWTRGKEGIAQVIFFQADEVCETSYADKKGKYEAQRESRCRRLEGDQQI